MIFRRQRNGLLAVTQPDHGRLAGDIAQAWGGAAWRPEPWEPLCLSARHHDDGWAPWEEAPTLRADGTPVDFLTLPAAERVEVYRRSVEIVAPVGLHAGLLTSLHVSGLFLGRFDPGHARALDQLAPDDRALVEDFLEEQEAWRREAAAGLDDTNLWAQYHLLQVYDMLSLTLCMRPGEDLEGLSFDQVPLEPGRDRASLAVHRAGDRVVLDPWPFVADEVTVGVDARVLPDARFPAEDAYRAALRAAPVEHLRFTLARR